MEYIITARICLNQTLFSILQVDTLSNIQARKTLIAANRRIAAFLLSPAKQTLEAVFVAHTPLEVDLTLQASTITAITLPYIIPVTPDDISIKHS